MTILSDKLPVLEFSLGSLEMPASQVLAELGYEDPLDLQISRLAEDLADDPRVKEVMANYMFQCMDGSLMEQDMREMQDMIRELSEQLKGKPSIISRLKDKRQPSRRSFGQIRDGSRLEAERLKCLKVTFEPGYLRDKLAKIK